MESYELSNFFNDVTNWSTRQADLDALAGKVQGLLGSIFVAVFTNRPGNGIGMKVSGGSNPEAVVREKFIASVREQAKALSGNSPQIKHIPLTRNELYPVSQNLIQDTALIRLAESESRTAKDSGGIVVGSALPMTRDTEATLEIVATRVQDLMRISELESAVQIRGQFLSIASHELKTPLTSIYGILQLQERMLRLRSDQTPFPDQDRHYNFLKMVIRQVERLNELIDGLLDVSRIQNGRFMVEPSDTDVAALLRECVQSRLNVIAQEAGVSLQVDSVANLVARVDPVRMEEVISNLVMNAIRFSPEGGVVWIRLRAEEDGAFRLTVRDQGPSIPMEDRERIFHPFERAQRTARMGGLGLGLFISRQIAQLHGGNVSLVESVPGKGNVFEAYFPTPSSRVV